MLHQRIALSLGILTVALILMACGGGDGEGNGGSGSGAGAEPVKVGLLNPLSGVFALPGEDVNKGFELYVELKGGQLGGHPVEIVKEDDETDPNTGLTKIRKLIEQDRVDVVVGVVSSAVGAAVRDYVDARGTPLLITVAGADDLTQRKRSDAIFRISYTGSQVTHALGQWVCDNTRYRRVAIVGQDYLFGWEAVGGFANSFTRCGGQIVQEIYGPLGTADWGPFIQQIRNDVDAVFVLQGAQDAVRFFKQYREFGKTKPVIAHGSSVDETILPAQGDSVVGVISAEKYSGVLDTPENNAFVEAYRAKHGARPSQYSEAGWLAALVLDKALADVADPSDHKAVQEALSAVSVVGPRGPVSFDEYHQAVFNVYIREVRKVGSEYQNVVIDTIPDVSQFWTFDPEGYLDEKPYAERKGTWAR